MKFNETAFYKILEEKNYSFLANIVAIDKKLDDELNKISDLFDTYTDHSIQHSYRTMEYMYQIIGDTTIKKISQLEIAMLCLIALFHDSGMIYNDNIIPSDIKEKLKLQNLIRKAHGIRVKKYIEKNFDEKLFFLNEHKSQNLSIIISDLCRYHNENFGWLEQEYENDLIKTFGKEKLNIQFVGELLRLADLLDIDENRVSYKEYQELELDSVSDEEWKQHFVVRNDLKVSIKNRRRSIVFEGECSNPLVCRKLFNYINWINSELVNIDNYEQKNANLEKCYCLGFHTKLIDKIVSKGFEKQSLIIDFNYKKIRNLFMSKAIYPDRRFGLREILQNSFDACFLMNEIVEKQQNKYIPSIKLEIDDNNNSFKIIDNGTGMSKDIIDKYFLNVGESFYNSADYRYKYSSIGKFGIGFLASFLISTNVEIITKHFQSVKEFKLLLEESSEVVVSIPSENVFLLSGTEIKLRLNEVRKHFEEYNKKDKSFYEILVEWLKENFNVSIEISIDNNKDISILHLNYSDIAEEITTVDKDEVKSKFDKGYTIQHSGIVINTNSKFSLHKNANISKYLTNNGIEAYVSFYFPKTIIQKKYEDITENKNINYILDYRNNKIYQDNTNEEFQKDTFLSPKNLKNFHFACFDIFPNSNKIIDSYKLQSITNFINNYEKTNDVGLKNNLLNLLNKDGFNFLELDLSNNNQEGFNIFWKDTKDFCLQEGIRYISNIEKFFTINGEVLLKTNGIYYTGRIMSANYIKKSASLICYKSVMTSQFVDLNFDFYAKGVKVKSMKPWFKNSILNLFYKNGFINFLNNNIKLNLARNGFDCELEYLYEQYAEINKAIHKNLLSEEIKKNTLTIEDVEFFEEFIDKNLSNI